MTTSAQAQFRPDPRWLAALLPQKTISTLDPEILDALPRALSRKRQNELDVGLLDLIDRFPKLNTPTATAWVEDPTPAFWGPLKMAASAFLLDDLKKLPAAGWLQLNPAQVRNVLCRPIQLDLEEWLEQNLKPGSALKALLEAAPDELLAYGGKQAWELIAVRPRVDWVQGDVGLGHWDRIHSFFGQNLFHPLDKAETPDLTQQTFTTAFRRRSRYDALRGSVQKWLDILAEKEKDTFLRKRYRPQVDSKAEQSPERQKRKWVRREVLESDLTNDPDDPKSILERLAQVVPPANARNIEDFLDAEDALLVRYWVCGYSLAYITMATQEAPFKTKYAQVRKRLLKALLALKLNGFHPIYGEAIEPHDQVLDPNRKDGGRERLLRIVARLVSSCQFEFRRLTEGERNRVVVWHAADTELKSLLAPPGWSRKQGLTAFFNAAKNDGIAGLLWQNSPPQEAQLVASGWLWHFWFLPENTEAWPEPFPRQGGEL